MRLVLALCLVGCEFTGFDRTLAPGDAADAVSDVDTDGDGFADAADNCPSDANTDQLDWDLDGHGDACDGCPHLASTEDPDTDGDHVGDACDPRVGVDARVIWLGFHDPAEIVTWPPNTGTWNVVSDALVQSDPIPGLAKLDSPLTYSDVYVATSIVVGSLPYGGSELGVCGGHISPGVQYYCCAIYGPLGVRAASTWPGLGYQASVPATWEGTLAPGDKVDVTGLMGPTTSTCTFAQGVVQASAATSKDASVGDVVFYTTAATGAYRYLFVVAIGL
jgi:hypothetical protein